MDSHRTEVELSYHVLERWHRRVRPDLSFDEAANELCLRLQAEASVSDEPPAWLESDGVHKHWLVLEDFAFPVVDGGVVTTVFTRSKARKHARKLAKREQKVRERRSSRERRSKRFMEIDDLYP